MTNQQFINKITQVLISNASKEYEMWMTSYMRHQFNFIGVATPIRKKITLPIFKDMGVLPANIVLDIVEKLWQKKEREYQYVALSFLKYHEKILTIDHLPRLIALAQVKPWWDTIDTLSSRIGDIIKQDKINSLHMDNAIKHEHLWVRRIAIIHQLGWKEKTDEKRLFHYASELAHESDFFIRKAIGWALRDYARHNPSSVIAFTKEMTGKLSPLSLREAVKRIK